MEDAWAKLRTNVEECKHLDNLLQQKAGGLPFKRLLDVTAATVADIREAHTEFTATEPVENLSDERIHSLERYTDGTPLKDFEKALQLVPMLVNLVSLADALPMDGSALPFDLRKIAIKCRNAVYFAPRRFTAVQLAFDEPRSRVLLFHTGRIVGTGCNGPVAAKLAILRALKAISEEAGVHIAVRRFGVINQVGAVAMEAKLNCDEFANTHSSDSHYDKQSFVGLAVRFLPAHAAHLTTHATVTFCCSKYYTGVVETAG